MRWGGSAWAAILMGTGPTTGYSPISGTGDSGRHSVSPSLPTPRLSPHCCYPSDNVTVAAYINKQGGTRSTRLKSCGHGAGAGILSRSPSTAPGRTSLLRTSCPAAAFPPRSGPSTPRSWPLFPNARSPLRGSVCVGTLCPAPEVLCAGSGSGSVANRAFSVRWEVFTGYVFPPTHPPNSTEGEAGSGFRPPHCPVVAEENVVPRNDNPSSGVSENPPRSQGRDIPADTGDPAP